MEMSILNDIKKMIGLDENYIVFDQDLIIHINSVFMILTQMGVGPEEGYRITGALNEWSEFTNDNLLMESVKTYIYQKVRLIFDPPQNSALLQAIQSSIKELEWRLNVANDRDLS